MLLDHEHDVKRIMLGYQFHFGVGVPSGFNINDCNNNPPHPCALKDIGKCCYRSARGNITFCPEPNREVYDTQNEDNFVSSFKKNSIRRIRSIYRTVRDTLVIKLDDMPISQLRIGDEFINFNNSQNVVLSGLISIQVLGVCTISIWIEGYQPVNEILWRNICDPTLISFTLAHANLPKYAWSLSDLIRYVSLKCHNTLNPKINIPDSVENKSCIQNDKNFYDYLKRQYEKSTNNPISYNIVSYPFFCIQYDLDSNKLNDIFSNPSNIKDTRLVLYGDSHWKLKTDDVIIKSINEIDVTTRKSIHWLVTSQGTLKILSNEINNETSFEESFTATLLETDIVLTMRYFLQSIMFRLSELSKEIENPAKISETKEQVFISMDKYYNIDLSHNDQTIKRINKFKTVFHIDEVFANVKDRMEVLAVRISNENSAMIEKQQIFLTIIFGLFGSLEVFYPFFQKLLENTVLPDWIIFIIAFISSSIIAGIIFKIVRKIKIRKKI